MTKKKTEKILEEAEKLLGLSYKYGACYEDPGKDQKEFDCSSFVQFVYSKVGVDLPRSTILQAERGREVRGSLSPADLLFFEGERGHYRHDLFPDRKLYIGHVAIYAGNNEIIHAVNTEGFSGVTINKIHPAEHTLYNVNTVVLTKRYL